jgi:photosystem II stability/assembly factor-like uncharacterized protein
MKTRWPFGWQQRLLLLPVLALMGFFVAVEPGQADDPPKPPRSKAEQIAELEKQIKELMAKLDALKNAPAEPKSSTVPGSLPIEWTKSLTWRSIGPATMGGRITDIAVFPGDPSCYYIATASGGLLKTVNNGITFEHQFDKEATVSIGAVAVAPSNRDIVWVGTGEANPRNSVSYGDGVYKSTDGGKTWKNMGLTKSFQIGRIIIHPTNPDIVYVGALGRLYGPNEERGVYKTTDGGKTWQRIWYKDDKTGVIDMVMHPTDPNTLLIAAWERKRDEYDNFLGEVPEGAFPYDPIVKYGQHAGIYKTTDGGKTFRKLTKGLPTVKMGRIGLDYYRKDPKVVFAIIDTEKVGSGRPPAKAYLGITGEDAPGGALIQSVSDNSPAAKGGLKAGDLITKVNDKEIKDYDAFVETFRDRNPGEVLKLTVNRGKQAKPLELTITLGTRPDAKEDRPSLGVRGQDDEKGVRVLEVVKGSSAEQAGLQVDDLLLKVNGQAMPKFQDFARDVLANAKVGDKLTFQIERNNMTRDLVVTLAPARPTRPNLPYSAHLGGQKENVQDQQGPDGYQTGGVFRSDDGGETWRRINSLNPRPMYFSTIRVDPTNDQNLYVLGISIHRSTDGGKTFKADVGKGVHADQHALWINPNDGRHMIIGTDGGFYVTYDRMQHWDHINTTALGQFYHVCIDNQRPARVYGGLQDNGTWGGPIQVLRGGGPINEDWLFISGGDGFVCRVDPFDPDLVYFESQDGNMGRRNLRTGERAFIRPKQVKGQPPYRFNWNTPFILSSHNPKIFYAAGNFVFRSVKQGDDLRIISPEITRTKKGSATALAESPRNPDVLWVGSDDGAIWVTRDGGREWKEVGAKLYTATGKGSKPLVPGPRWVASIEPSRFVEGRAYIALDAHRSDDDNPYLFVTEDFGQTWTPITANLPVGSTRVLREDRANPNLLYCGTEFAAYASTNRGGSWTKINNNLPTVAIHEFAQHPTTGEMVAATHGRSLWVVDVTPLRQLTPELLKGDQAALFAPDKTIRWRLEAGRESPYSASDRRFVGTNPPRGAVLYYLLPQKADKLSLKIFDFEGKLAQELKVKNEPGLNRVEWGLTRSTQAKTGGGGFTAARAGNYRVVLTVNGKEYAQPLLLENDPTLPPGIAAEDIPDDVPFAEEEDDDRRSEPAMPRQRDDD